jgi:hypothetical protein
MDQLCLYRGWLLPLPARLAVLRSGIEEAAEALKRAEAADAAATKKGDADKSAKAAADLSAAVAELAGLSASAAAELQAADAAFAAMNALNAAAAAEAAKVAQDSATLAKLRPWVWNRSADRAMLEEAARQGNALASLVTARMNMLEGRPAPALDASTLPASARPLLAQSAIWAGAGLQAGFAADSYYPYGKELQAVAASLEAPAGLPARSVTVMAADGVKLFAADALAGIKRIQGLRAGAEAGIQASALALLDRANARMRLRLYQYDSESLQDRRELSDVYLKLNRPDKARDELLRVLAISPGDTAAGFTLGRTMELNGDWHGAMERYRAAFEQDPKYQSASASFNRLAKVHADRFSADVKAFLDTGRTAEQTRLGYAYSLSSAADMEIAYAMDHLRILTPAPVEGAPSPALNLHTLDLSFPFAIPAISARVYASLGGSLQNKLNDAMPASLAEFTAADINSYAAVAPRWAAGASWNPGWLSLATNYRFSQVQDTFFAGRLPSFSHEADLNASGYFSFASPSFVRALSLRLYARGDSVSSPFSEDSNLRYLALAEAAATAMLSESPWTPLTLGASVSWEDSRIAPTATYYSPGKVLVAKGGLSVSTGLPVGKAASLSVSGRYWAGVYSVPAGASLTMDAGLRAEYSMRDMSLYASADASLTGSGSERYWYAQASVGAAFKVADYIIPR